MMELGKELQIKSLSLKRLKAGHLSWIKGQPSKAKTTFPKIRIASQA
tara:strand:- start:330 stop:470 length:141 start_codon:yes stop_codon:yes gene_type:complete